MFLVIDDETDIRELVAEFFNLRGYTGRAAEDGRKALDLLRSRPSLPKLILLDLSMPTLDGWGFLLERANDPRLMSVPVILVSATPGIEARAKAAGAYSVLRKPVEANDLLSAAEPFLKS